MPFINIKVLKGTLPTTRRTRCTRMAIYNDNLELRQGVRLCPSQDRRNLSCLRVLPIVQVKADKMDEVIVPCSLRPLPAPRVDPNVILQRGTDRGYPKEKSRENAEAEGIGYLLHECMEEERKALNGADWSCLPPSGRIVLELDVTPLDPTEVAEWVARMAEGFEGKRLNELSPYRPGRIDWIEVLSGWF